MAEPAPQLALSAICAELERGGRKFALVGGLAVSVRAEVRFTRDVDLVVGVNATRTRRRWFINSEGLGTPPWRALSTRPGNGSQPSACWLPRA